MASESLVQRVDVSVHYAISEGLKLLAFYFLTLTIYHYYGCKLYFNIY